MTETDFSSLTEAPEAAPVRTEPDMFSVIGFTNASPSTGVRKGYSAIRTPIGWQVAGAGHSTRLGSRTSWEAILAFAEAGTLVVFGTLPVPEAPQVEVAETEDDEDELDLD